MKEFAGEADFTIVTMDDTYQGYKKADIQLASWDTHLNEKGHELVANSLYTALMAQEKFRGMTLAESLNMDNSQ